MTLENVQNALTSLGFEILETTEESNRLRFVGRVPKARMPTWVLAIETLDIKSGETAWTVDISQKNFVPPPLAQLVKSGAEAMNGMHVRFAWRIIFQAKDGIAPHYGELAALLGSIKMPQAELMQVPLSAPPERNALVRGKGARPLGSSGISGPAR